MQLTKNFSLEELTTTESGLLNIAPPLEVQNLTALCKHILQPLREAYGGPITVNSGYRSVDVNTSVGGDPSSQHLRGEAADITAGGKADNKKLYELVQNLNLDYDQLINEYNFSWVHVSYHAAGGNRHQAFAYNIKK